MNKTSRMTYGALALVAAALLSGCAPTVEFERHAVPGVPGFGGTGLNAINGLPGGLVLCFYSSGTGDIPAATMEYALEVMEGLDVVHARLTFSPDFVDNSYGQNAIGWEGHKRGHVFQDLTRSDHAELIFSDKRGGEVLRFKQDYLSEAPSAASGFANLGLGGDGALISGKASWITATMTSIDRNLNERGYAAYAVDSPATGASYSASAEAPDWDYRVVYEAWVDKAAFGSVGFGDVYLESVHASPSKLPTDTLEVYPAPCPTSWVR
jgi:hypothetical protein